MFKEGDFVKIVPLFKRKRGISYVVKLKSGAKYSTEFGLIMHDDIIGRRPGTLVESHLGERFIVIDAKLEDIIRRYKGFKHLTQIIYPKDWGLIVSFADIKYGSKVVEVGMGSGAFTAFLSRIVGEKGHIWSYEYREERYKEAKRNLEELELSNNITFKLADATKRIDEKDVDVVFIDIPEPWKVVDNAWLSLRDGGTIVIYVPTMNQLKLSVEKLIRSGFIEIKVLEGFIREIQYKTYAIRPVMKGYIFSAYVILARKSYVIPYYLYEMLTFEDMITGENFA